MGVMKCVANEATADAGLQQCDCGIVICNECGFYNRGECSRTGEPMHPEDYCSKAVRAE